MKKNKKDRTDEDFGFLMESNLILNIGFVWDGGIGETIEFRSVDEMPEAGWIVD